MSGIYGIISKNNDTQNQLSKMVVWNRAYGNDEVYSLNNNAWSMGICYEHITNSPVPSSHILQKEDFAGVIDAVIYNRAFLCNRYNVVDSISDEELIFSLVITYGYSVLADVNGDFAGAIYNDWTNDLVLFRDHLGIRPLYYYCSNDCVAFSTGLRGLLALDQISGYICHEWLYKKLCGYGTESDTLTEIQDVFLAAQSSYITISTQDVPFKCKCDKYWKLGSKKIHYKSEKQYIDTMRDIISNSVKKRLDVFPDVVGAELSGGLDSGVISILLNRYGKDAIYYSWSADPKDVPYVENDERYVIKDICDQENIECNYVSNWILDSMSNIGKRHENIGLKYDSEKDIYTNYAIPLYVDTFSIAQTSQYVSKNGGKVVFTGHGGDEGVSHRSNPFELFYHKEYIQFIKLNWALTEGQKHRLLQTYRLAKSKISLKNYYINSPFVYYKNAPKIVSKELLEEYKDASMPVDTFVFDVIQYVNDGCTNVRPKITAFLGAYSGARYVFPYLDKDVIDYAVSIPRYLYQKNGISRYIFRQAFRDIMPQSLFDVTIKETPSENKEKKDPPKDWFTKVSKYNKELLESLDRNYWMRYLNYDELNKWANSPCPSDEEKQNYFNVSIMIRDCLRFQNMVKSVKSIANKS